MNVCRNCGGEEGLHEYDTLRCPRNGQESPLGRRQLWQDTFLDMSDEIPLLNIKIDGLENRIATLERVLTEHLTVHLSEIRDD